MSDNHNKPLIKAKVKLSTCYCCNRKIYIVQQSQLTRNWETVEQNIFVE